MGGGQPKMIVTAVPETPVDEHRDALAGEDYVGSGSELWQRTAGDAVSEAHLVQKSAHR